MAIKVNVRIDGMRAVLQAFSELPFDAQKIVRARSQDIAQSLIAPIRTAASSQGRQASRAGATVQTVRGQTPAVTAGAGGDALGRAVLLGSEFGATRHFGWYRKGRYFGSDGKQFPPHRGAGSYWFFRTVEAQTPRINKEFLAMAQEICEKWGRG